MDETVSGEGDRQAAKTALRDAERSATRTRHAYLRLFRERRTTDTAVEPSEAEVRAEAAYRRASDALAAAREHLKLLDLAAPTARKQARRTRCAEENCEDEDGWVSSGRGV